MDKGAASGVVMLLLQLLNIFLSTHEDEPLNSQMA